MNVGVEVVLLVLFVLGRHPVAALGGSALAFQQPFGLARHVVGLGRRHLGLFHHPLSLLLGLLLIQLYQPVAFEVKFGRGQTVKVRLGFHALQFLTPCKLTESHRYSTRYR